MTSNGQEQITFGIDPNEPFGTMTGEGVVEDGDGLGDIAMPGFCQQNTELLNKDQRAQCGLPISLSRKEQQALMDHDAALRDAMAREMVGAETRKKKIKLAVALVGFATAGYFLYRWHRRVSESGRSIFSLATIKESFGFKSNPPRRKKNSAPRCEACDKIFFEEGSVEGHCKMCAPCRPRRRRRTKRNAPVVRRPASFEIPEGEDENMECNGDDSDLNDEDESEE